MTRRPHHPAREPFLLECNEPWSSPTPSSNHRPIQGQRFPQHSVPRSIESSHPLQAPWPIVALLDNLLELHGCVRRRTRLRCGLGFQHFAGHPRPRPDVSMGRLTRTCVLACRIVARARYLCFLLIMVLFTTVPCTRCSRGGCWGCA